MSSCLLTLCCLQVASTPSVLKPGHSTEISITFVPTAAKEYTTAVPLRVMGLYDINIPLKGTGGQGNSTACWQDCINQRVCGYCSTLAKRKRSSCPGHRYTFELA
jgi:hypothetical protein